MTNYVSYEIERCREYGGRVEVLTGRDSMPGDFWTVYGRLPNGEAQALSDHTTLEAARAELGRLEADRQRRMDEDYREVCGRG